jgi:hypothetical protein
LKVTAWALPLNSGVNPSQPITAMYYKVIEYFGPKHPAWYDFSGHHWIKPLLAFDSIDGILCPDVFTPSTKRDWSHCVTEDFKISLLTDLEYARQVRQAYPNSRLVGVEEDTNCDGQPGLLGYDILDEYNHVSVLTNWGPNDEDHPLKAFPVASNGLISSYESASAAASFLRREYASADHASGATVWAIFSFDD